MSINSADSMSSFYQQHQRRHRPAAGVQLFAVQQTLLKACNCLAAWPHQPILSSITPSPATRPPDSMDEVHGSQTI